ncbi:MAG: EAL domain-containing protein [Acidimicrobiales bacterium]
MSKRSGPAPQRTRVPGREQMARVVSFCPEAFIEVDATGIVTEWNPQAEALFGWRRDEVVGQRVDETVLSGGLAGYGGTAHVFSDVGGTGGAREARSRIFELLSGNGQRVAVEARVFALGSARSQVDERVAAFLRRLEPAEMAPPVTSVGPIGDPLTGLPTREQFEEHLTRVIERESNSGSVAVVLLDLDRFKAINHAWGRDAGDAVLAMVAGRLRRIIEGGELIARYGGDAFLALFVGPAGEAQRKAAAFIERARGALAEPLAVDDTEVFVEVTVGVALNTFGVTAAANLLANAEAAMHEAKERGGAGMELFGEGIRLRAVDRMATEHALHRALERDELVLHYQPVIELDSMVPTGAEALIRWHHPAQGLLAPSRFIPVAEESGLILPIGAWVIAEACAQLRSWDERHRPLTGRSIDVNLSALQIDDPRLVRTVGDVLARTGLPPECLTLEITESALVRDPSAALVVMGALKDLGVQLAIDDFGTGYSSLSHLQRFPLDVLKVDRMFVAALRDSPQADRIVAAVIDLAHTLGLQVVAEGVETVPQLEALRSFGCDYAQGHLFSPPVPADVLGPQLTLPLSA